MKTLDEVIKGFECCQEINCAECPYANWDNTDKVRCDPMDKEDDSLHYLKAFRDAKNTLEAEKDRYAEAVKNCERAENKYRKLAKCADPDDPDGDHQQLLKTQALLQDFFRNEPLTWDELQQMEGKPVWVEWAEVIIGDYFQFHEWFLVEWINDNENEIIMRNKYGKRMIRHKNDNDWQAYRKERS